MNTKPVKALPDGTVPGTDGTGAQAPRETAKPLIIDGGAASGSDGDNTMMRGIFARSLCSAHHIATMEERQACDDGTPCQRMGECVGMADRTLMYLEYRNRLPGEAG